MKDSVGDLVRRWSSDWINVLLWSGSSWHDRLSDPRVVQMSVRPRSGAEVPDLAVRVARAANPKGTTAMWVRDRLEGLWSDEDFIGWYPRDGATRLVSGAAGDGVRAAVPGQPVRPASLKYF